MTNYKEPHKWILAGHYGYATLNGDSIKYLFEQTDKSSAADSFFDVITNAVYVVPAGFKFQPLMYVVYVAVPPNASGTIAIHEGATENVQTTAKNTIPIPFVPENRIEMPSENYATIAAGKYLVYKPTSAQVHFIECYGVEIQP